MKREKLYESQGGFKIKNQNSIHFVTLTIVGWIDVFTRKEYRDLILESLNFCQKQKGLIVFAFVIMSNHIHLIVRAKEGKKLSNLLRDLKKFTAQEIIELIKTGPESRKEWLLHMFEYFARFNTNNRFYQFWQQNNHPIELVSPKWIRQKLDYIHLNPVRAGWVKATEDYLYSSAPNYLGKLGLLEVDILDPGVDEGYIML